MHCIVTGGSGFIGTCLSKKLVGLGHKVTVLDIKNSAVAGAKFAHCDIRDSSALNEAFKDADIIFHLASLLATEQAGKAFLETNVAGTRNVLEAALRSGAKKVVHMSTSMVYGQYEKMFCDENCSVNPIGDYGKSKLAAEDLCRSFADRGLDITIIRPGPVIGSGRGGLFEMFYKRISKNKFIPVIGSGKNFFQMLDVNDLVDLCILAAKKKGSAVFNAGSGCQHTFLELVNAVIKHANSRSKILKLPNIKPALAVLNKLGLSPLQAEHYEIVDTDYVLDISKAKNELRWKPAFDDIDTLNAGYDWFIGNMLSRLQK